MKPFLLMLTVFSNLALGQGLNHQWLMGSFNFFQDPKGRMLFDANNYSLVNENRKMVFKGTEANISNSQGNLLISSNGIWVANSIGDTMLNGANINPGTFVSNFPYALPITNNNIILPFPADSDKYVLFHHTAEWNGISYPTYEIMYSIINITLDSGLGGIIPGQKSIIALSDTLNWGLAACKHANGRDWWITAQRFNSDSIYTILLTSTGVNVSVQQLNIPDVWYNATQPTFSPDGKKFAFAYSNGGTVTEHFLYIFDFDRCSGLFSNPHMIDLSSGGVGWGLAFSPNSKMLYVCSSNFVYQIEIDPLTFQTVATYDGFISPVGGSCCATTFWNMYLAANGKIYVTSGSGVEHLHEINYPDSGGIACDVQQHAISLGYTQLRAIPNHPNYYLGCDTTSGCTCLTTGIENRNTHDFKFSISPIPAKNYIKAIYLLPENKKGKFEIFDVNGKLVYSQQLSPWSTMLNLEVSFLSTGIYNCSIISGNYRCNKKLAISN